MASGGAASSGSSGRRVTLSLYRSLLRTARPFDEHGSSSSGRILSSLLHRTGIDHDEEHASYVAAAVRRSASARRVAEDQRRSREAGEGNKVEDEESSSSSPSSYRDVHLPREYARDLSRPYRDLQRTRWRHQGLFHDDEDGDTPSTPSHEVLFRGLLREALGGGPALMRFPSQVQVQAGGSSNEDGTDVDSSSLGDLIRREFRAGDDPSDWTDADLLSSAFDDRTRVRTAFLSLRELNRKLRYAECHGLDLRRLHLGSGDGDDDSMTQQGEGGGLMAGGDGDDDSSSKAAEESKAMVLARRRCGLIGSDANRIRNARQAARGVRPLPLSISPGPTSKTGMTPSYLRPGTYLVAHPLVDGFFSRSVIVILDHTEEDEGGSGGGGGGTYGVIVNKAVAPMVDPAATSTGTRDGGEGRRTHATMEEVIRTVPHGLRVAFGDAAVRNGGPVNAALQMIHTCSPEMEERVRIGGNVLPMVDVDLDVDLDATGTLTADAKASPAPAAAASSGPQQSGGVATAAADSGDAATAQSSSSAAASLDTDDHAVYFQGDPIRAAQAVLSGDVAKHDVSFLVGASCWTVGQLESEVAKGWWMPCSGPPRIALTGRCEYDEDMEDDVDDGHGRRQPQPQPQPRDDLWLSMMCALGQEEGDLAHLLLATDGGGAVDGGGEGASSSYDENGEPCDDF